MPKVRPARKKQLDADKKEGLETIMFLMNRRLGQQFTLKGELWEIWSPVHLWNHEEKACFCLLPWLSEKGLDKIQQFIDILDDIEPLEEEPEIEWEEFKRMKGLKEGGATALVDLLMRGKRSMQPRETDSKPGETMNESAPTRASTWWSMEDLSPSESSARDVERSPF